MIENLWYAILDAKELKKNKPIGVTRFSKKLVLWRDGQNKISCIADQCCHRGASLSLGQVKDEYLECPFHGFLYDSTGKVKCIPANGAKAIVEKRFFVEHYTAKEAYGFIWVWYGQSQEPLPEIKFFHELEDGFSYGGFSENWGVHYTRAIENQLDVVHLPFVHKTTIGKGNKTLVNGPVVTWEDDRMTFYVKNEFDDGQIPERPDEIKEYETLFHLQLQMPNIWQNIISDQVRILAVFAPIDEENTRIYIRFYQSFMKVPLLKQVINALSIPLNKTILHQDRRVVLTQKPKKSELSMGENLIQGDLPIIEFRKKREELKNKARL